MINAVLYYNGEYHKETFDEYSDMQYRIWELEKGYGYKDLKVIEAILID